MASHPSDSQYTPSALFSRAVSAAADQWNAVASQPVTTVASNTLRAAGVQFSDLAAFARDAVVFANPWRDDEFSDTRPADVHLADGTTRAYLPLSDDSTFAFFVTKARQSFHPVTIPTALYSRVKMQLINKPRTMETYSNILMWTRTRMAQEMDKYAIRNAEDIINWTVLAAFTDTAHENNRNRIAANRRRSYALTERFRHRMFSRMGTWNWAAIAGAIAAFYAIYRTTGVLRSYGPGRKWRTAFGLTAALKAVQLICGSAVADLTAERAQERARQSLRRPYPDCDDESKMGGDSDDEYPPNKRHCPSFPDVTLLPRDADQGASGIVFVRPAQPIFTPDAPQLRVSATSSWAASETSFSSSVGPAPGPHTAAPIGRISVPVSVEEPLRTIAAHSAATATETHHYGSLRQDAQGTWRVVPTFPSAPRCVSVADMVARADDEISIREADLAVARAAAAPELPPLRIPAPSAPSTPTSSSSSGPRTPVMVGNVLVVPGKGAAQAAFRAQMAADAEALARTNFLLDAAYLERVEAAAARAVAAPSPPPSPPHSPPFEPVSPAFGPVVFLSDEEAAALNAPTPFVPSPVAAGAAGADIPDLCLDEDSRMDYIASGAAGTAATVVNDAYDTIEPAVPAMPSVKIHHALVDRTAYSSGAPCSTVSTCNDHWLKCYVHDNVGSERMMDECLVLSTTRYSPFANESLSYISLQKIVSRKVVPVDPPHGCKLTLMGNTAPPVPENESCMFLLGAGFLGSIPSMFSKSQENERICLLGRHLTDQLANSTHLRNWERVSKLCARQFFDTCREYFEPVTQAQWLSELDAPRREVYSNFIKDNIDVDFSSPKQHFRQFFLKAEVKCPPEGGSNHDVAPRGIQGMVRASTNIALGPFMASVSHAFSGPFLAVDIEDDDDMGRVWPQICYTSGATNVRVGQWYSDMRERGAVFFENDFSAFDASQGKGCHIAECTFFQLFGPPPVAIRALNAQARTTGYGKWYNYTIPYTRKSGDQNTSLGNSYINAASHVSAISDYCAKSGIAVTFSMLVLGDDNLLAVFGLPADDAERQKGMFRRHVERHQRDLGLKPKMKSSLYPSYCSSEFMPILRLASSPKYTYTLVPSLLRFLTKHAYTHSKVKPHMMLGRLKADIMGNPMLSLLPVARVFFRFYTEIDVEPLEGRLEWKGHTIAHSVVQHLTTTHANETLQWFHALYDITSDELLELETFLHRHLVNTKGGPSFYHHPLVAKAFAGRRAAP